MKLIIVGHARHGKDTVAEIICKMTGLKCTSSSMIAAEHVVMPYLAKYGVTYNSVEEAFEDRINHRASWYNAITAFNTPYKTSLANLIFQNNDIYVGLRNQKELWAIKAEGLVDCVIWVDALDRLPPEPKDSMGIEPWEADFHIDNNGPLEETEINIIRLLKQLDRILYEKAISLF